MPCATPQPAGGFPLISAPWAFGAASADATGWVRGAGRRITDYPTKVGD